MKNIFKYLFIFGICLLTGCTTFIVPRYHPAPNNTRELQSLGGAHVKVDRFLLSHRFDASCRGSNIEAPVNMTFESYIQNALTDELKSAGLYDEDKPTVTLNGSIDPMRFSSSKSVTSGEWLIGLTLTSSNGRTMSVTEHFEFTSGFEGTTACNRTADAFVGAIENLMGKVIRDRAFPGLIESTR